MKCFRLLSVLLILVSLCSCVGQREMDLNELVKKINADEILLPPAEEFSVYGENNEYRFSCMINSEMLLCVYSGNDGKIRQITLTGEKCGEACTKLRTELIKAFTDTDIQKSQKLLKKAVADGRYIYEIYNIAVIDCDIGETLLLNYAQDEINTNENPTLKRHVSEDDVSRPTAAAQNKPF